MNIVAVVGSPNGMNGNTGLLLKQVLEQAQRAGAQTETCALTEHAIQSCIGCYSCAKTGICPIEDDFEQIKKKLISADGIIFASPNYMFHITSQMKAFIDRSFSFLYHCRRLTGKYGVAVATSGGVYAEIVESYLLDILAKMGCWNVGSISIAGPQLFDESETTSVLQEAAALGGRLVAAIKEQQPFKDQEANQGEIHAILKALVIMQKDDWPFEYAYWKNHWGLAED